MRRVQPIPETTVSIEPVDRMTSHGAHDSPVEPYGAVRTAVGVELFQARGDEIADIVGRVGAVYPWQPLAQVCPVAVYSGINLRRVQHRKLPELQPRRYRQMKHQSSIAA